MRASLFLFGRGSRDAFGSGNKVPTDSSERKREKLLELLHTLISFAAIRDDLSLSFSLKSDPVLAFQRPILTNIRSLQVFAFKLPPNGWAWCNGTPFYECL